MSLFVDNFHFLRPYWLLFLIPAGFLWLAFRRSHDPARQFGDLIAPHLLQHLVHRSDEKKILHPVHVLLLLWFLLIVAIAGPSWQMKPTPFAKDNAGLMILIQLGPSMKSEDLRPSRLERVRHKLHDLFQLRTDGSVGLIAYSGSSHLVMPLTQDKRIIEQMADALDPSLMPLPGDALAEALTLAAEQFTRRKTAGSILVITDSVNSAQLPALSEYRKGSGPPVQILAAVGSKELVVANGIEAAAKALGSPIALLTVDETDVQQIVRRAESQVSASAPEEEKVQWQDGGYTLIPIILLGLLLWARRGWEVKWES
jgi:Ca-activated chloride channel family protein